MKMRLCAAIVVITFVLPSLVHAQEYSDDEEYGDEPVTEEIEDIDRSKVSDNDVADANKAYVIIYNRKDFRGFSRKIYLRNGSRISLSDCNKLHDNVRSMKISAPRHATVVLLEKALVTYSNQKMAAWWGWGTNVEREVNKRSLTGYKMYRDADAMLFLFDGYYWNNALQRVTC